jgi:hypothetical protein
MTALTQPSPHKSELSPAQGVPHVDKQTVNTVRVATKALPVVLCSSIFVTLKLTMSIYLI